MNDVVCTMFKCMMCQKPTPTRNSQSHDHALLRKIRIAENSVFVFTSHTPFHVSHRDAAALAAKAAKKAEQKAAGDGKK